MGGILLRVVKIGTTTTAAAMALGIGCIIGVVGLISALTERDENPAQG